MQVRKEYRTIAKAQAASTEPIASPRERTDRKTRRPFDKASLRDDFAAPDYSAIDGVIGR